jgi:hypothetical protein
MKNLGLKRISNIVPENTRVPHRWSRSSGDENLQKITRITAASGAGIAYAPERHITRYLADLIIQLENSLRYKNVFDLGKVFGEFAVRFNTASNPTETGSIWGPKSRDSK